MTTYLDPCHESIDLGSGRFQHVAHLRPIAYRDGSILRPILNAFAAGDANWPHVVTQAPMLIYCAADGMRRICPTRDPAKFFEIGAPYIRPAAMWQKVALGAATRDGNQLRWATAQADMIITMAGHFIKLEIPLKGGWEPPGGQFAFPIGMQGLTRQGLELYDGVQKVLTLRRPVVYDANNPDDVRQVAASLVDVSGQSYVLFTLPSLAGMVAPVIDPTLTLQPEATAGKDTYLASGASTFNYGVGTTLRMTSTTIRCLIDFDLSSIPASATCDGATLYMYCSSQQAYAETLSLYIVAAANRDWVEGTSSGAQETGTSCWDYKVYNTATWAGSAGLGTATTDYDPTAVGSYSDVANDPVGTEYSAALTAATIQGFFAGTLPLHGRATSGNQHHFAASSDHATAGYRPRLVVDYTLTTDALFSHLSKKRLDWSGYRM